MKKHDFVVFRKSEKTLSEFFEKECKLVLTEDERNYLRRVENFRVVNLAICAKATMREVEGIKNGLVEEGIQLWKNVMRFSSGVGFIGAFEKDPSQKTKKCFFSE